MLDHVFTDAIAAVREVLETALLEPQLVEERLHADILAGDLTWQTTYSLPGEGNPPRVQADLTLEWSTWSQSAYRSWRLGETPPEPPRIGVEVILRVQRLRHQPEPQTILAALPAPQVTVGPIQLERNGPRLEISWDDAPSTPSTPSRSVTRPASSWTSRRWATPASSTATSPPWAGGSPRPWSAWPTSTSTSCHPTRRAPSHDR